MKRNRPRGKTPSLIGRVNGKPLRVEVERKSKCSRCKIDIEIGQDCFGIPTARSRFVNIRRYCKECYFDILDKSQKDLDSMRKL